jgi:hypothetical protein
LGPPQAGECLRGWRHVASAALQQKERARVFELEATVITQRAQMLAVRAAETVSLTPLCNPI